MGISKITIIGDVDSGKSTLIETILNNSHSFQKNGSLYNELRANSKFMDGLIEERNKRITISNGFRSLRLNDRRFILVDAPGHKEFFLEVLSALIESDFVIMLIDSRFTLSRNSRNLIAILKELCLNEVLFLFNKTDLLKDETCLIENEKIISSLLVGSHVNYSTQRISCKTNAGVDSLIEKISSFKVSTKNASIYHIGATYSKNNKNHTYLLGDNLNGGTLLKNNKEIPIVNKDTESFNNLVIKTPSWFNIDKGDVISDAELIVNFNDKINCIIISSKPLRVDKYILKYLNAYHEIEITSIYRTDYEFIYKCSISFKRPIYWSSHNDCRSNLAHLIDTSSYESVGVTKLLSCASKKNSFNVIPSIISLTGLSGSGKSFYSNLILESLNKYTDKVIIVDNDYIRETINSDLGFSEHDKKENMRRLREISILFYNLGYIVILSAISPYRMEREALKVAVDNYIEVFIDTPLEVCIERDNKRIYSLYEKGKIKDIAGLDSPFERPFSPDYKISYDNKEEDFKLLMESLPSEVFL